MIGVIFWVEQIYKFFIFFKYKEIHAVNSLYVVQRNNGLKNLSNW